MKRYRLVGTDAKTCVTVDGNFYAVIDLHAWALKHKWSVQSLPHMSGCSVTWDRPIGDCPRCDALREIEEIIQGSSDE